MLRSDVYFLFFLFPVEKKKNPKEKHDWEKISTMRSKVHRTKKYSKSTSFQESAAAAAYFHSF